MEVTHQPLLRNTLECGGGSFTAGVIFRAQHGHQAPQQVLVGDQLWAEGGRGLGYVAHRTGGALARHQVGAGGGRRQLQARKKRLQDIRMVL